jgi:Zn-dependent peptidase ImmA (M78 family)
MPEVPVNGRVLEWARNIRGLKIDDAAMLLGVSPDELRAYESGQKLPLVGFLRRVSAKYRINFTSLLMPEPLPIEKPPTDHRSRRNRPLSMDTLLAIEEVTEALQAFEDIAEENKRIVPALNIGRAQISDNPEDIAARERRTFGVTIDEQRAWNDTAQARRKWRLCIEDRGVFTYMIPMPPNELSGFSILRNGIGAICVNDRETTEGAKVFTLFHEYCHLLLRQAGISDEGTSSRVEKFCNEFAACFLIPRTPLVDAVRGFRTPCDFSDDEVRGLAARFRVSNRAMALRLEKTGLATRGFYGRRTAPWDLPDEARPRRPQKEVKIDNIKIQIKRFGRLHGKTVVRALKGRIINSVDAYDLINVRPSSLGKFEAALG